MSLEEAWAAAVAALGPDQRLLMFQDKDGPQYVQVLAPTPPACSEHEDDDEMRPIVTKLAAYPRHGLGNLISALEEVAVDERVGRVTPTSEPLPSKELRA